jgi:hypothetical protein
MLRLQTFKSPLTKRIFSQSYYSLANRAVPNLSNPFSLTSLRSKTYVRSAGYSERKRDEKESIERFKRSELSKYYKKDGISYSEEIEKDVQWLKNDLKTMKLALKKKKFSAFHEMLSYFVTELSDRGFPEEYKQSLVDVIYLWNNYYHDDKEYGRVIRSLAKLGFHTSNLSDKKLMDLLLEGFLPLNKIQMQYALSVNRAFSKMGYQFYHFTEKTVHGYFYFLQNLSVKQNCYWEGKWFMEIFNGINSLGMSWNLLPPLIQRNLLFKLVDLRSFYNLNETFELLSLLSRFQVNISNCDDPQVIKGYVQMIVERIKRIPYSTKSVFHVKPITSSWSSSTTSSLIFFSLFFYLAVGSPYRFY